MDSIEIGVSNPVHAAHDGTVLPKMPTKSAPQSRFSKRNIVIGLVSALCISGVVAVGVVYGTGSSPVTGDASQDVVLVPEDASSVDDNNGYYSTLANPTCSAQSTTCTANGVLGLCTSVSAGCCGGGTFTSGLCPGSSDIKCCTKPSCTTPRGAGVCSSSCSGGTAVAGYCYGPSSLTCCVPTAVTPKPPTVTAAPPTGGSYLPPAPKVGSATCKSPNNGFPGTCIGVNDCSGGTHNGLCAGSAKCCVTETNSVTTSTSVTLTTSQFSTLFPSIAGARATAFRYYFNAAASALMNDNPSSSTKCFRLAAFIAQLSHESEGLLYFEELASGSAYEGRSDLGNVQAGDGKRYKGRGPIQLTGRANYRNAGTSLGLPLEAQPDLVCLPSVGFRSAVWFWMSNKLNTYATSSSTDFVTLTRRINGGTNGLADRQARWATAKSQLGC